MDIFVLFVVQSLKILSFQQDGGSEIDGTIWEF